MLSPGCLRWLLISVPAHVTGSAGIVIGFVWVVGMPVVFIQIIIPGSQTGNDCCESTHLSSAQYTAAGKQPASQGLTDLPRYSVHRNQTSITNITHSSTKNNSTVFSKAEGTAKQGSESTWKYQLSKANCSQKHCDGWQLVIYSRMSCPFTSRQHSSWENGTALGLQTVCPHHGNINSEWQGMNIVSKYNCDTAKSTVEEETTEHGNNRWLHIRIVTCCVEKLDTTNDLFELINCFLSNGFVAGVPVTYVLQLIYMTSTAWSVKVIVITYTHQIHSTLLNWPNYCAEIWTRVRCYWQIRCFTRQLLFLSLKVIASKHLRIIRHSKQRNNIMI